MVIFCINYGYLAFPTCHSIVNFTEQHRPPEFSAGGAVHFFLSNDSIYRIAAELLRKYGQSVNDICKYFDICIFGGAKPLHFSKHLAIIVIGAGNEARSQLLKDSQLILTERI